MPINNKPFEKKIKLFGFIIRITKNSEEGYIYINTSDLKMINTIANHKRIIF